MKKNLFLVLMFMVMSAASVNAQVRIGGIDDPNTSAILDLNATDTTTVGKLGLALPRVSLVSTTTQLNGANPLNGTMVYNTNASMTNGQGAGIYVWNAGKWSSLVSNVPVTSVTLSPQGVVYIPIGTTVQLTATTTPVNATNSALTWTSSTTTTATVSESGLITPMAVGSTTVTVATTDGSGNFDSVSVNVFADGSGTTTMDGRSYNTYTFPNGAGTWMTSESKAGIADTIINGSNFYSYANALTACTDGWVLADSTAAVQLVQVLSSSPYLSSLMANSIPYMRYSGDFYKPTQASRYVGDEERFWFEMTGDLRPARASNYIKIRKSEDAVIWKDSSLANHWFTVKCWHP
ncbi:MAG: Ig-like domain-containing protein [Candidatus Symbiothrix sp.]|nr:Ig-like domain-containing protein [Candidatus Symbiothrix sp.]